ncbi:acyl-CoA dehydrogenase family protein [Echinicola sp. 20G]|uniref:acyl-CoA dehydrogenase family protein n=1 Tax=Echinicola sp. 20G TaxID=2781961 RepID=UPI00190FC27E|nr:acyl-CoA dehydrogenase family protein [Echinicola sp. 20G]
MEGILNFSYGKLFTSDTVLDNAYMPSKNFFVSDQIFVHFLQKEISKEAWAFMQPKLSRLGYKAASLLDHLSLSADKNPPFLKKRDAYGRTINEIIFHPDYKKLLQIAVESGMFSVKWDPDLREEYKGYSNRLCFSLAFLYGMGESGVSCPLCMTDGVARVINSFADAEDRERLMKHIYTNDVEQLFTGAMFLTEKSGGSDVGTNMVSAQKIANSYYLLNGEKWFCSNANAEIKLVLARTNPDVKGTEGLSLFLVEKHKPDGQINPMDIIRLKDKLGTKSMASAEIILTDTFGKLIGKEGEGFKIMVEMINLSRLWNSVIAVSAFRRCLIEAYQFLSHRHSFGRRVLDHALVRKKLYDLSCRYTADFYLTWKAISLLDKADSGDASSGQVLRMITPMVKRQTAETSVYGIRECMELMGGMGYIEDTILPKFMRDTLVLPIWEGTSNMMVLDMLRTYNKDNGLLPLMDKTHENLILGNEYEKDKARLTTLLSNLTDARNIDKDHMEINAEYIFEELTFFVQKGFLLRAEDSESTYWIGPALKYLNEKIYGRPSEVAIPPSTDEITRMIGWGF